MLKAFVSDGCSGGMSWLWQLMTGDVPPWECHCVRHDRAYHRGGSAMHRRMVDLDLARGVERSGHPVWAWVMFAAVRVGGSPYLPLPWRWAFGRPYWRRVRVLGLSIPLPRGYRKEDRWTRQ